MPKRLHTVAAAFMVGQSESLPMMIPTAGGFSAEGGTLLMGLGCITRSRYGNAKSVSPRLTTA